MTATVLPEPLLDYIRELHSGADRGYHAWSHPLALLALLPEVEGGLHDPLAVRCAILLHDAIYEPRRTDNESRSAELAREILTGVISPDTLDRTVALIEATKAHAIPDDLSEGEAADLAVFLDMDLSILAASSEAFDAYEDGVRHEYHEVPTDLFRMGRAAILESFLARDHLYMSPWGLEQFEGPARSNLRRSITALRAV